MLLSLGYIFLFGMTSAWIAQKCKLPRIIGMLLCGILIGPYLLGLLDEKTLLISQEIRKMALVVILVKAGLTLNISDLKKVGRPAVLMAFVPATAEFLAYRFLAPGLLGVTSAQAAVMGAVLAAVSPAVVVPRMVHLLEEKRGTNHQIPQMILAGASLDDIYVIVLFSTFLTMAQGGSASFGDFLRIPSSILLGILLGVVCGWGLMLFFRWFEKKEPVSDSYKVIITLGLGFVMLAVETWLESYVAVSGLLAIVTMACVIRIKDVTMSERLASKYGKLWLACEILLFVLVGAAVDIRFTLMAGPKAIVMILVALVVRSFGVVLCVTGTQLNKKERLYCVLAYLPKATVQAAIGSVPMAMGLPGGEMILSAAVLGILITAPLGAILMDYTETRLLEKE